MRALAGTVLTPEGWMQGHVLVEEGRVVACESGAPPVAAVAEGIVVPAFVNAHTHLGDAAARGGPIPRDLVAAVAPPDGYKHRILASTPRERLLAAMQGALAEVAASGARGFVDFREGGVPGLALLDEAREAPGAAGLEARVYGRPAQGSTLPDAEEGRAELHALLARAQGLGVSALADDPRAAALAEAAHGMGRGFALHHDEGRREPIEPALALEPDHLVHLTFATRRDLAEVAEAGLPVAVCPRSNAFWVRRVPDVRAMLDLGIPVGLGTDNAMLGPCDVRSEARALLALAPRVAPDEALRMLSFHGWRILRPGAHDPAGPLAPGAPADLLVYHASARTPRSAAWDVLRPDARLLHRERAAPLPVRSPPAMPSADSYGST